MTLYSANPDELHALGSTLQRQIAAIDEIVRLVDGPLHSIAWTGPARDRFVDEWNGNFKASLTRLTEAFDAVGNECIARADAVRVALGTG